MPFNLIPVNSKTDSINRGFSKQAVGYDEADKLNLILQDLRQQVYHHVCRYLRPQSHILELNAGTGIDALFFASKGHVVHATDLSDGMIEQIQTKISINNLSDRVKCQQLSYENLDQVLNKDFDYAFSNFGGLNCVQDLSRVTQHLPKLLKPGAYVTCVVMPPICPWELLWIFKGRWKQAFRRLKKNGVMAHLEGEHFRTYYHSVTRIRAAFGSSFKLVRCEGLAALSPQPHHGNLPLKYPRVYQALRRIDALFKDSFPFNRCADHCIVTFQYQPNFAFQ